MLILLTDRYQLLIKIVGIKWRIALSRNHKTQIRILLCAVGYHYYSYTSIFLFVSSNISHITINLSSFSFTTLPISLIQLISVLHQSIVCLYITSFLRIIIITILPCILLYFCYSFSFSYTLFFSLFFLLFLFFFNFNSIFPLSFFSCLFSLSFSFSFSFF